jgi:hypothetical protein
MNIHLSDWIAWSARESLPDDPGIYLIAKAAPGAVVYIGKTWGGDGLRGRIRGFNRSALTGLKGHAGGVTYHGRFGPVVGDLHIAVHVPIVVRRDPEILYAYVHYVERRLIWEHVERHGALPVCNAE